MKPARIPLLPVDQAKAAADEAGVPDYMAELSIFQILLNHPRLARTFNDFLATMLWHGALD
ncbi:MAG: carboxymuconolactone decarboxylase family protein, partial [Mycobacterium sp.]